MSDAEKLLFTDAEAPAAPLPPPALKPFTPEQQATLDRLARNPETLLAAYAMRVEQVTVHGHSDAHDSELPLVWLPKKARDWIGDACDVLREENVPADKRLPMAKRKLLKAIAIIMAGVDRIDLDLAVCEVEQSHRP